VVERILYRYYEVESKALLLISVNTALILFIVRYKTLSQFTWVIEFQLSGWHLNIKSE